MKFLALKVDFDGLSLDFLGSRKPAHEGIRERYPRKSRYFVWLLFVPMQSLEELIDKAVPRDIRLDKQLNFDAPLGK